MAKKNYKTPEKIRERNRLAYQTKRKRSLQDASEVDLPLTLGQKHQSVIIIRVKSEKTDLSNEFLNWKHANKLFKFLVDHCPSGIFNSLFEQMKDYKNE